MMDNELLRFDRLAASVARRIAPPRAASPPQPTRSPLFSLLLLREWLRLTYQDLEDLLRLSGQLRRVFGLRVVLDTATVWRFPRRHVGPACWTQPWTKPFAASVGMPKAPPRSRSTPSVSSSHTSRDFEWRAKWRQDQRGWLEWTFAMWVAP